MNIDYKDGYELHGKYFTVEQFANKTNRTTQTIYHLIRNGNCIRKLKSIKLGSSTVLIPVSELTEFPFTTTGRNAKYSVYHYDKNGNIIENDTLEELI